MRVPALIGSSVEMNRPPVLILAMFFRTREGPLLLFVSSYSTCAVIGARSKRRRSNCAELFIPTPLLRPVLARGIYTISALVRSLARGGSLFLQRSRASQCF